ncbi:MAG: nucleotidyltransferase family protein [Desulfobacca sp.]|uniref:nucleotidyltransferase family protein n=1 Tax=Desulfobacca sp. TaxID=2067990 RepID=UPI004049647D
MPPLISALLLAAGSSSRMGQPKALLPLQGRPAILHCLAPLLHGSVSEIIVVLGNGSEPAAAQLKDMSLKILYNTLPQADMVKSVRIGLQAMAPQCKAALICLVDHPLVQADTIKQIVAAGLEQPEKIIIPTFQERRGQPTLFPKSLLTETYQGFHLQEIIGRHADQVVLLPVPDEGVVLEMNTPEEYQALCQRLQETSHG